MTSSEQYYFETIAPFLYKKKEIIAPRSHLRKYRTLYGRYQGFIYIPFTIALT